MGRPGHPRRRHRPDGAVLHERRGGRPDALGGRRRATRSGCTRPTPTSRDRTASRPTGLHRRSYPAIMEAIQDRGVVIVARDSCPRRNRLRARETGITDVIVGSMRYRGEMVAFFTDLLGRPPVEVDGVALWRDVHEVGVASAAGLDDPRESPEHKKNRDAFPHPGSWVPFQLAAGGGSACLLEARAPVALALVRGRAARRQQEGPCQDAGHREEDEAPAVARRCRRVAREGVRRRQGDCGCTSLAQDLTGRRRCRRWRRHQASGSVWEAWAWAWDLASVSDSDLAWASGVGFGVGVGVGSASGRVVGVGVGVGVGSVEVVVGRRRLGRGRLGRGRLGRGRLGRGRLGRGRLGRGRRRRRRRSTSGRLDALLVSARGQAAVAVDRWAVAVQRVIVLTGLDQHGADRLDRRPHGLTVQGVRRRACSGGLELSLATGRAQ